MRRLLLAALAVAPALVHADAVYLRGGGKVTGTIVERTAAGVVLDVSAGRITLPASRIERVDEGPSALALFNERAHRLVAGDTKGWLALALWARDHELGTPARVAFERVLALDPANRAANEALGRVQVAGKWMTREESLLAAGYVPYDGTWVTPVERDARLAEERSRDEGDARVREAEARAREAEAQADAASRYAASGAAAPAYGYPYGGYGGMPYYRNRQHVPRSQPTVVVVTPPSPPRTPPPAPRPSTPPPKGAVHRNPLGP